MFDTDKVVFNCTVDTKPMANAMITVRDSVSQVSGAVNDMKTAIVNAEDAAARKVSNNVSNGFYSLIRSQISQKIASISSIVNSKFMELSHQSAALASIKGRMERDYMRIASRYTKLFNSLNQALRSRVFELDKYVAHFVNKDIQTTITRVRTLVSAVPLSQSESITISQKIASSRLKNAVQKLFESMQTYLSESIKLNAQLKSILTSQAVQEIKCTYLPIAITETVHLSSNTPQNGFIYPKSFDGALQNRIEQGVQAALQTEQGLKWQVVSPEERSAVSKEFNALIQRNYASDRVKKIMGGLFDSNTWQTVKG